jgi:hypothetical protein
MNYDQTYCASPTCTNECGRKLSDKDKKELSINGFDRISYAYFCGVNHKDDIQINQHKADVDRYQHESDGKVYINKPDANITDVENLYSAVVNNTYKNKCKKCGEFYR